MFLFCFSLGVFLVCCKYWFPPPQITAPSLSSRCSAAASRNLRAFLQRSGSTLVLVENPWCNTRKNKNKKKTTTKQPNKAPPPRCQTSQRCASGQTCDIDCTGRDLLAWKGDRDAAAAKGQNCPFLYVKSPVAQFGHKIGTLSFTQQSSNQSINKPLA